MKKFLARLFCLMLITSVAILGLVGCSEGSWQGNVTLKNSGEVMENGGFIAETDNYLYFINGIGSSTSNNSMGEPLKGALLVADKDDLTKTEVVVPKLFVASDYNAGVFIDDGYVYYATPSVEKNSQGNVASDELSFMRTKLDGSGKTDVFFTLDGDDALATEYRIVKGENGGIFIYYYDEDNLSLVCYNTSTKTSTEIIKQSDKANGDSLDKFMFLKSGTTDGVVGYYITTVYLDTYNADSASKPNYTRNEALYNRIYVIKAGSTVGELVADGEGEPDTQENPATQADDVKYSLTFIKGGYVFFTTTNTGRTETYAISTEDAITLGNWTDENKITKIVGTSYLTSSTLIVSLEEVYVVSDTKIYKTTLTAKDAGLREPIALKEDISKLLFVDDGFIYFYNAEGHIARLKLNDDDQQMVLVSADTAATGWYDVKMKEFGGKKYLFYCDNSLTGKSYIKCVDLSADVVEKDTDNDGENDLFYLDTEKIIVFGKMTDSDSAAVFESKVELQATYSPADGIGANKDDDDKFRNEIEKLMTEYEELPSAVKEKVSEKAKNTLNYIEKAFDIALYYEKLNGIADVGSVDEVSEELELNYNEIKKEMQAFKNSDYRDAVDVFISNNLKANWTKAVKLFEGED